MKHNLYLSNRNVLTLLSKLDRQKAGEHTACAIIKHSSAPYQNTMSPIYVGATENGEAEEYPVGGRTNFVILERRSLEFLLAGNSVQVFARASATEGGVEVTMVSDEEMYASRAAGEMYPSDEANLPKPDTGVMQSPLDSLPEIPRWTY